MPLTAGTPLDVLVDRLAKAGWGDLSKPELRGLGRVLNELARVLPPKAGAGKVTAPQLAGMCGYTERWVRRCLTLLEELEVIQWDRGGIVAGKPVPSWIRVSKAALVDLIHLARTKQGERTRERAIETRVRMARLRTSYTQAPGHRRKRKPSARGRPHAELVTALLSTEEVPTDTGLGRGAPEKRKDKKGSAPALTNSAQSALARMRSDLAAIRHGRAGNKRHRRDLNGSSPDPGSGIS